MQMVCGEGGLAERGGVCWFGEGKRRDAGSTLGIGGLEVAGEELEVAGAFCG